MTSLLGQKMIDRLPDQFKITGRLIDLIKVINNRFDDTDSLIDYLMFYRFLDTASGVWLDTIGVIVGVLSRPYESEENIFTYGTVSEISTTEGFSDSTGLNGGHYMDGFGLPTTDRIDDDKFRVLIKAKIFATNVSPTIPNIYTYIKNAFGIESIVTVPETGSVSVEIAESLTVLERAWLVQYAPVAAGINIAISNWP